MLRATAVRLLPQLDHGQPEQNKAAPQANCHRLLLGRPRDVARSCSLARFHATTSSPEFATRVLLLHKVLGLLGL